MKNIPYKKEYNLIGEVTNPITKGNPYINRYPNRATRRKREPRFIGNGKNTPLVVIGNQAYYKIRQYVPPVFIFNSDKCKWEITQSEKFIYRYQPK